MNTYLIKDLFDIRKGRKENESDKKGIRYIQIEDLRNSDSIKHCEQNDKNVLVDKDDVIIAWDGANAGIVGFGIEGALGSTLGRLRMKETINKKDVNPHYLGYLLKSKEQYIKNNTTGATIPHVSRSVLENIELILPDLDKQNKVVYILDSLLNTTQKRQQQIEALSALKQSVFLDMFGDPILNTKNWEIVKLSDIGKWQSGGTPSRKKKEYYEGEIPWLSSGELNNIYISNSNEYITKNAIEESSAKLIAKNSLLLGMYDTAGLKSSINLVECSCNQAIAFAEIDEKYAVTEFVYYTIQIMREYLLNQQRGVRQKNFNLTMIKNIEIISPPVELQQEFLDKVNIVFDKEKELERSLVLIKRLFNSTLYKAFNGELFKEEIKA